MFVYWMIVAILFIVGVVALVLVCLFGDQQLIDANGNPQIDTNGNALVYNSGIELLASWRTNNNWWPIFGAVLVLVLCGAAFTSGFGSPVVTTGIREGYTLAGETLEPLGNSQRLKRIFLAGASAGNTELEELAPVTQKVNWVRSVVSEPKPIIYKTWFWWKAVLIATLLWLILSPLCLIDEVVKAAKHVSKKNTAKGKATGTSTTGSSGGKGYNMALDWVGDFMSAFFGFFLSSLSRRR